MNDRLLEILSKRADFKISDENKKLLDFFVEYLDHGSLFLAGFEPGSIVGDAHDAAFFFTNDAERYRFSMNEIREHVLAMKRGTPMEWDRIKPTSTEQ